MKRLLLLTIIATSLIACNKESEAINAPSTAESTQTGTPQTNDSQASPAPIGSGVAGGMTPMTNTDSVVGSGGNGAAMAAKEMAKNKAAQAGSSVNQMPADEGN